MHTSTRIMLSLLALGAFAAIGCGKTVHITFTNVTDEATRVRLMAPGDNDAEFIQHEYMAAHQCQLWLQRKKWTTGF